MFPDHNVLAGGKGGLNEELGGPHLHGLCG